MRLRKIFAAALLLLSVGNAMAQMPPIPVDKNVKIGHLENGLTYYIRHNAFPEHVASFYIAQKVGSINENDDQRGLAHLLEHLAFNGTEHFKGNSSRITCRASAWSMVATSMPIPASTKPFIISPMFLLPAPQQWIPACSSSRIGATVSR